MIVAFIPEGLLPAVTLSLALAVYNRRETLKVLRRQDGAMLVISAQKETKAGKNP